MNKRFSAVAAGVSTLVVSGASFAQTATTDVGTLFGGVDLSDVKTHVLAVGATVIAIALAFKGITLVKKAISKV